MAFNDDSINRQLADLKRQVDNAKADLLRHPGAFFGAKGELLVGTASGANTNLPVGTNGQMLVADSTQASGLAWRPSFATGRMYQNTGINFNSNTESLITGWTQEVETDANIVDVATSVHVIYARRSGYYLINYGSIFVPTGTTLNGYVAIKSSSGAYVGVVPFQNVGGFYDPGNSQSTVYPLAAGEWIALYVYANWTGGGVYATAAGGRYGTFIEMTYLGDQ